VLKTGGFVTSGRLQIFCVPAMSALGQKPTCAAQKGMSALHPKATVKADIRKTGKSAWRTPAATIITRLGSVYFSVRETLTA
jgi:hypothetical protein